MSVNINAHFNEWPPAWRNAHSRFCAYTLAREGITRQGITYTHPPTMQRGGVAMPMSQADALARAIEVAARCAEEMRSAHLRDLRHRAELTAIYARERAAARRGAA